MLLLAQAVHQVGFQQCGAEVIGVVLKGLAAEFECLRILARLFQQHGITQKQLFVARVLLLQCLELL